MKPHTFTRTLVFILFACAIATLSSCSKKKEALVVNSTNLVGTYKIATITTKENNEPEEDVTAYYFDEACEMDDEYVLKANGGCDRFDAGTACTPPTTKTGDTWALINNKTIAFDEFYGDVVKLTSSEMTVKLDVASGNQSITVFFNFVRK